MKKLQRILAGSLMFAMVAGYAAQPLTTYAREVIPKTTVSEVQTYSQLSGVEGFVTRLYNICLDREPDETGFNDWVNKLKSGVIDGAEAAYGFIFSKEFKEKNPCNDCYLDSLYRCFLGREPDKAGKADWMNQLTEGAARGQIFNGFVGSQEFTKICESYGISRGDGDWSNETFLISGDCGICGAVNKTAKDFVTRLYDVCLDRQPDEKGLSDWIEQLNSGKTGAEVAYGFIFSNEFQNKNLCNEHYVDYMYRAFFGRESDATGKATWTSALVNGTKGQVFDGFIGSQEFMKLCAEYGIKAGTMGYGNSDFKANGDCVACTNLSTPSKPAETKPSTPSTPSKPSETQHVHTWEDKYELIRHDEVSHMETRVVQEAWTEENEVPVYGWVEYDVCPTCGWRGPVGQGDAHIYETEHGNYYGDASWEQVSTEIEYIYHEAVTEEVKVVDQEAYTESIYVGTYCTECGAEK